MLLAQRLATSVLQRARKILRFLPERWLQGMLAAIFF
jgi:hypothetical protein